MTNGHHGSESTIARIMVCWSLQDPSGIATTCELVRTATGLQLQCCRGDRDAPVRVATVENHAAALELAARWEKAYATAEGDRGGAAKPFVRRAVERSLTILEKRALTNQRGDLRRVRD